MPGLWAGPGCAELDFIDDVICLDSSCPASGGRLHCFPIEDGDVEPISNFARALETLIRLIEEGRKVYVHCYAGCGRTGTLVSAYLIIRECMTYEEAVNRFRARRGCGPESWCQEMLLRGLSLVKQEKGPGEALRILRESRDLGEFIGRVRRVLGGD